MKRELGIARCGLACCLCSENEFCKGCRRDGFKELSWCKDAEWCVNRKCVLERNLRGCYECHPKECFKGIYDKNIKAKAFAEFAKRYGVDTLLDCLEENEKNGLVYHRIGIIGDYDGFSNIEDLIQFIKTGEKKEIVYELARLSDINDLVRLRLDYLVEDFKEEATNELDYYEEQVRSHLKNNLGKNLIGFIARKNGTIIATAYLLIIGKIPNPTVRNGRCGEVLSVYTDPHYRGQGIAKTLLEGLIEYAREKNLTKIDLKATESGLNLYKKVGFKELKQKYTNMRLYL